MYSAESIPELSAGSRKQPRFDSGARAAYDPTARLTACPPEVLQGGGAEFPVPESLHAEAARSPQATVASALPFILIATNCSFERNRPPEPSPAAARTAPPRR